MERRSGTSLLIHLLHWPILALGPGKRLGLWVQGCSIHCEGCISRATWPFDEKRAVGVRKLLRKIARVFETEHLDGLTVSGGEPFDQGEAFPAFLKGLRKLGINDVLVFSGYKHDDLLARYPEIPELLTTLVDSPFELGNETDAAWKGSGNQTMTLFRPEYQDRYSRWAAAKKGGLQIVSDAEIVAVAGIPYQRDVPGIKEKIANHIIFLHSR
ncbi:MAG: radical SAM protein [Synergistaceae bacterium]|nr:radical SAM protein [Synergistaceae bacterium]